MSLLYFNAASTFVRMFCQNSSKTFDTNLPANPKAERVSAALAVLSLGTRHVFEMKLLPTTPVYLANAGAVAPIGASSDEDQSCCMAKTE